MRIERGVSLTDHAILWQLLDVRLHVRQAVIPRWDILMGTGLPHLTLVDVETRLLRHLHVGVLPALWLRALAEEAQARGDEGNCTPHRDHD